MSGNQQTRRRVSYNQLEALFEFLNAHREVAVGYNKSAQARQHSKEMWARAADLLSSAGDGAIKTGPEWSKYWVDLKAKIKRKNRIIRDASNRTGGGPPHLEELSEVEKKFLSILGDDYGSGLPMVQVNPFPDDEPIAGPSGIGRESEDLILEEWLDVPSSEEQADTATISPLEPLPSPVVCRPTPMSTPSLRTPSVESGPSSRHSVALPEQPIVAQVATPQPRRRRRRHMTAAEARVQLVEAARQRAASEAANSSILKEALVLFQELVTIIRTRYAVEEPRDAPQDPAL